MRQVTLQFVEEQSLDLSVLVPYLATLHFFLKLEMFGFGYNCVILFCLYDCRLDDRGSISSRGKGLIFLSPLCPDQL
jgi:hypothetical protein